MTAVGINLEKCFDFVKSCRNQDGGYRNDRRDSLADSEIGATRWAVTALKLQEKITQLPILETVGWSNQCFNKSDGGAGASPNENHSDIESTTNWLLVLNAYGYTGNFVNTDKPAEFYKNRQRNNGGFGDEYLGELVDTYRALVGLHLVGKINKIDKEAAKNFILSHKDEETGGFKGDFDTGPELSYTFYGLASLYLLQKFELDRGFKKKTKNFIIASQNEDGGMGSSPGQPNTIYNLVYGSASLNILGKLKRINSEKAIEFISSCQADIGGFCTRPGIYDEDVTLTGYAQTALHMLDQDTPTVEAAILAVGDKSITNNLKYGAGGGLVASEVIDKLKEL